MSRFGWTALALSAVAVAAGGGVLLTAGDDGKDDQRPAPAPATAPKAPSARSSSTPSRSSGNGSREAVQRQVREAVAESKPARLDPDQLRVARAVRAYVAALDRGDGAQACRLLAPGALSGMRVPRRRPGCDRSVTASIGYRDPRGFPVFAGARVARIRAVAIDGAEARVTATTVTRFADDREPSVEDDVIYLQRRRGRWLIEKPGVIFYRAIGVGDIPPRALAPP